MFTRMLAELDGLAPATLPAFVEAAAGTPRRAFAMGRSLYSLGAPEQAFALVAAALDAVESADVDDVTEDDVTLVREIAAWLDATVATGAAAMASSSATASALAAARTPLGGSASDETDRSPLVAGALGHAR
jgi:hypothetical protein